MPGKIGGILNVSFHDRIMDVKISFNQNTLIVDVGHLNSDGETKNVKKEDEEEEKHVTSRFEQHRVHDAQLLMELTKLRRATKHRDAAQHEEHFRDDDVTLFRSPVNPTAVLADVPAKVVVRGIVVAKALDGQRYPLTCVNVWVCDGERGSGPEGGDDLCLLVNYGI